MAYDAIVVGAGAMGSAAAYHLARRGRRVLALERFDVPHEQGSSHGVTRIIRLGYAEGPDYVPLLRRSYELWRELEERAGERLLHVHGGIDAGLPESHGFAGALASCRAHDLPHEVLDAAGLARRFPAYRLPGEMLALLQPDGGFLLPERCIVAHVEAAQAHGAEVRARERVLDWEELAGGGVRVRTDRGAYEAERLVLAPGAWADSVARLPRPLVTAERQVLGWFQPRRPELFAPGRFPIFVVELDDSIWYGFPVYGIPGFKLGRMHHREEVVDPDEPRRPPDAEDEALLRAFVERCFPEGNGPTLTLKTCLFENSPDSDFVLDVHPEAPSAVVGVGFSGHGFKFASVVGEILADLAVDGSTRHPIEFLRFGRFAAWAEATLAAPSQERGLGPRSVCSLGPTTPGVSDSRS